MNGNRPLPYTVRMFLPTGDAGDLRVAQVPGTRLNGVYIHARALERAMALAELDLPGLLMAPRGPGPGFASGADVHETRRVRDCLRNLRGHFPEGGEAPADFRAFTLVEFSPGHLRHMAARMPDLFPAVEWHFPDWHNGAEIREEDAAEAEEAVRCIERMAAFLEMPVPQGLTTP